MTDFYPILARSVHSLDPNTAQARADLFGRARSMLLQQLRNDRLWTEAVIEEEMKSFDLAVEQIEADLAVAGAEGLLERLAQRQRAAARQANEPLPGRMPRASTVLGRAVLMTGVFAGGLLLSGLITYAYLSRVPSQVRQDRGTAKTVANMPAGKRSPDLAIDTDELEPGIDGGSTDAGLPYFLKRQAVYYRSVYSDGMIIIDRSQRYLYLVQPQARAWRYGIGVGGECSIGPGFQRITRKVEWPEWSPSPGLIKRRPHLARLAGGPGNPLGARALYFQNDVIGIHGTNAPKSIGQALSLGCFRLVNEDIVDLGKRVSIGAGVVVLN